MGAQKSSRPDGVFLAHMLVLAVLALVLYLMYIVVLDAMMNHKQAEVDRKRNENIFSVRRDCDLWRLDLELQIPSIQVEGL